MSQKRLPVIYSSESKTAKPPLSSPAQTCHRKRNQQEPSSSSSSHPHQGLGSLLFPDATVAPWGGLALSESSFTSIPPPPQAVPPPSPAPPPMPSTPYHGRQTEDEEASSSSINSESASPALGFLQDRAGGRSRGGRARRKVLPQRRAARPPRLPPLHPVTNLSFTRSFTFSFFELPLHQSPHSRGERIRNLMLLLKQIHY